VHLVGFIIRIYHDAWSPERHIKTTVPYLMFKTKHIWLRHVRTPKF